MQFALVALLAPAAAAARLAPAAPLAGRAAQTVSIAGVNDAQSLLEALAQPAVGACAGGPVALGAACRATFQCGDGLAEDPEAFAAAQDQLAMAVGMVTQSCICTCGTYCCPYCTVAVPEAVEVAGLSLSVTCD